MIMNVGAGVMSVWWLAARTRVSVAVVVACLSGGLVASESLLAVPASAAEGCKNEKVREEQGTAALALPECRAYELVTPAGAHPNLSAIEPGQADTGIGLVEAGASVSGDAVVYRSWYSPSESSNDGLSFSAVRGSGGWSVQALSPERSPQFGVCLVEPVYFSPELLGEVMELQTQECGTREPPVVAGEPRTTSNVIVRGEGESAYQLVDLTPEGVTPADARLQAASADLSHVFFTEEAGLVEGAPTGYDLYVWSEGKVGLVTYLPDGTTVLGALADGYRIGSGSQGEHFAALRPTIAHAVSSDGERAVFEANGLLYLRLNASREQSAIVPSKSGAVNGEQCADPEEACTIQIDANQGGSGPGGGGVFQWATPSGSRIFFTDVGKLTANATATTGRPDLYEYDVETGALSDLTPDSASYTANVQGVMGASEGGSYLYFIADGVLAENENSAGARAALRKPNLYLRHAGITTFIATLSIGDSKDWGVAGNSGSIREIEELSSDVSPNGDLAAFNSVMDLTNYETTPIASEDCKETYLGQLGPEGVCNEIYRYDVMSNSLVCVSCGPPESKPAGEAELRPSYGSYLRRPLTADGGVFFDTPSPLLVQDSNGVSDVYEWVPVGVAACGEDSSSFMSGSDGCLYSISSGTSSEPSYFVDASESGDDAFFVTSQSLVGADTDEGVSLYDARVGGGFEGSAHESANGPECAEEEACRAPLSEAPVVNVPASVTFAGGGNLVSVVHEQPGGSGATRKLTRAQKLAQALVACRKGSKRKRKACESSARRRYGAKTKAKAKKHVRGKGGRR